VTKANFEAGFEAVVILRLVGVTSMIEVWPAAPVVAV
jgi:hypothetical protein